MHPEADAGAGVCPSEGDQSSLQAFITGNSDNVTAALAGGPLCGNGVVDTGEDCEPGDLNGETCITQGFVGGGTLACGSACAFDTGGCWDSRYVDNGDGTITDRATGLMWEKKTEYDLSGNYSNLHDADNTYQSSGTCSSFPPKNCQPNAAAADLCSMNHEAGYSCPECLPGEGTCSASLTIWTWAVELNTASFAGYTDWRVPKRQELEAILRLGPGGPTIDTAFHGPSCGAACTDIADPDCSCTVTGPYLSAYESYPVFEPVTWYVTFLDSDVGTESSVNPGQPVYVRAVRGRWP